MKGLVFNQNDKKEIVEKETQILFYLSSMLKIKCLH